MHSSYKLGTVLYRRGADLLTCLSWALGQKNNTHSDSDIHNVTLLDTEPSKTVLSDASNLINRLLHEEISKLANKTVEPKDLDIQNFLTSINPLLFNFIEEATKTVRESSNNNKSSEDKATKHIKTTRRFFIICLLLYCINSSCHTPIHLLLADTVEICGGSRKLIKILNGLVSCHQMTLTTDL